MDRKASSIIFLSFFLVASASAFDILKLLEHDSELSSFSAALKESKLADQINKRSTVTVLAVDNGGVSGLSSMSADEAKKVLAAHVVLDYFDEPKLKGLAKKDKPTTVTTMLQSTGEAQNQQGFINVGINKAGDIAFGSAVKGSGLDSKFVRSVTEQPYNISVLQVSSLIEIPDLVAASPGSAPKKAPAPAKEDDVVEEDAVAPSPDDVDEAVLSSPPVSGDSPTEAPENAPEHSPEKPVTADTHAPPTNPSAASRVELALGAFLVMGLASILA
ncbi:fasciclin-like arabinogalactan protein 14 [Argentina anserina]|uniref:fasciclin-like arabinogalactan protein 14 n=1 Tax=Argentina anserina TaxID=57926 RepID=UPI0021767B11|nr:fasciclin-like arabinogalactan protein 14 [Potentilla anserina]